MQDHVFQETAKKLKKKVIMDGELPSGEESMEEGQEQEDQADVQDSGDCILPRSTEVSGDSCEWARRWRIDCNCMKCVSIHFELKMRIWQSEIGAIWTANTRPLVICDYTYLESHNEIVGRYEIFSPVKGVVGDWYFCYLMTLDSHDSIVELENLFFRDLKTLRVKLLALQLCLQFKQ